MSWFSTALLPSDFNFRAISNVDMFGSSLCLLKINLIYRRIGKCQNWKVLESNFCPFRKKLESVRIGKCQNWKVSELESVRIGKCQNWKVSELESVDETATRGWLIMFAIADWTIRVGSTCSPT